MKGPTKIVLGIGILLGAAVAGVTFEQVGRGRDRIRYPQVGQSFRLGERTVNMYCSGDGTPTVVFDSSAHTAGYRWVALQPQAAASSRACWYDRAGYGWSDRPRSTYVRRRFERSPFAFAGCHYQTALHTCRRGPDRIPCSRVHGTLSGRSRRRGSSRFT
jgi:hypothetical protein